MCFMFVEVGKYELRVRMKAGFENRLCVDSYS